MKIKEGLEVYSSDFWYDLSMGGYIRPEEILEDPADIKRVKDAVETIMEFEESCNEQIEGFGE